MKRDTDSTDFRGINDKYLDRQSDCLFCKIDKGRIINENNLAYLIFDKYPVTEHHALIIPKRHFSEYFDIAQAELNSIQALILDSKNIITERDNSIQGFNIGINSGKVAGQTIFHCHVHLIPRRYNDIDNPEGGIRNLIPGKGGYV